MSNYEYPRLKRSEIVQVLDQFGIATISEQEITNPKPTVVSELYTLILNHLDLFSSEEDNEQLEFDVLEHLDNPDLHIGSVRPIKVANKIKEVLNALECPKKFYFSDLVKPEPSRTEFFIGALLNFCLDRDGRMNSISEIVDEFSIIEQRIAEIEENKITQLIFEIGECKEAKNMEMSLVQEMDTKVKELRQTIANLNNQQRSLRTTLKKLKENITEMDVKVSDAEFNLVQNVQENASLRSKIAQSPEKVQRALEEKKIARDEARNAERLAMHIFHEKSALSDLFSKVNKIMSKYYKQMDAIQEQINSAKSVEKELKALKAKLDDEELLEKSLEAKLVERQSEVEHMEGMKKHLEKDCNIAMEKGTTYLRSKKSEVESKRRDIETRQRNFEDVLSKVDAINSEITSVIESAKVKVDQLDSKGREILGEFHKYSNKFGSMAESVLKTTAIKGAG